MAKTKTVLDSAASKIVHLSSAHPAFDIRIFRKECRCLAKAGYDVTLIAQHAKDEVIDDVNILGIPTPSGRKERMTRTTWNIFRLALKQNADIYHFHDPELIPVGLMLKLMGKRVIYDVHENAPMDVFHSKPYLSPLIRKPMSMAVRGMEILAGRMLDGIVTISDAFAARFPVGKTCVARNYPIVGERLHISGTDYMHRQSIVISTGGFARTYCAHEIVEAMSFVNRNLPATLTVVGRIEDRALAEELSNSPGWQHTDYMGIVDQNKVYQLLAEAKVGICINQIREDYVDISTNKLFDYMLAGIPVLVSPIPSWQTIVQKWECGVVVKENSPQAFADAIIGLLQDPGMAEEMGNRGRKAVLSCLTWEAESAKLIELYERVLCFK